MSSRPERLRSDGMDPPSHLRADMNPTPLMITTEAAPNVVTLRLMGEIDLSSSHLLAEAIELAVLAGSRIVIVDFDGVSFVNSTGLGAMVAATKRLRTEGGDLVLRSFRGIPASALATTGLDHFFTIES